MVLCVGCATVEVKPFESRKEVSDALKRVVEPFPYNVVVMDTGGSGDDSNVLKDSAKVISDALEKAGIFKSVSVVSETDFERALEVSRMNGAEIVILPRVSYGEVRYEDHTGWRIPKIIIWSISEFLSALIADEIYSIEAQAVLDLYSTYNRRSLPVRIEASSKTKVVLNDYQRGFKIWGIWRVPSSLHEGNYKNIREEASMAVIEDIKSAVLVNLINWCEPVRLAKLFKEPAKLSETQKPPVQPTESKKEEPYDLFLLAIGRDSEKTPSAERSAGQFLSEVKRLVKGEVVSHLLRGDSARFTQIENLVRSVSAREAKAVVVYLALTADADKALKLKFVDQECEIDKLISIMREMKPEKIVFFFDIFAPSGTWKLKVDNNTMVLLTRKPGEKFLLKGDVTLFCATFSTLFRIADINASGTVSAKELESVVGAWFMRQARLLRDYQTASVEGGGEVPFGAK